MTIQNYSKIDSMWDVLVLNTSEVEDMQRFTQAEKDFFMDFLAGTVEGLTSINTAGRANGDGFMRMCDATEVLGNLVKLYEKHEQDNGFCLIFHSINALWLHVFAQLSLLILQRLLQFLMELIFHQLF